MKKELNWAVLGCGVIANEMAQALEHMGKHLYAVGNRTHEKAVTFAEKYGVQKVYDDFHEMFHEQNHILLNMLLILHPCLYYLLLLCQIQWKLSFA